MSVILRFAPSPTGYMHMGNARTALVNWLFARHHGGKFYLRFDDTDLERSRLEYATAIENDMDWLGLNFDAKFCQADRLIHYQNAMQKLIAGNRLYACYESPEELDFRRKRQLSAGRPPIYDRAALQLTASDHQKMTEQGRRPHWRFLLQSEPVVWQDMAHGEINIAPTHLSDPILIRADGSPVYTLSSVVDDIDYNISHIIRGNDHITNTAVQIQLWQALGREIEHVQFAHLPLITAENGEKFSKSSGSLSIGQLRDQGIESLAILSYLSRLGSSDAIAPAHDIQEIIDQFDIHKFAQNSPKFQRAELDRLNTKIIHQTPYEQAVLKLQAMGLREIELPFWQAVQGNLATWEDVRHLWTVCYDNISPVITDHEYLQIALNNLPAAPWDETTWANWTTLLKSQTGRKGKDLFMPLRQALTAMDHGPEMQRLLPLIGHAKVRARLQGELA